MKVLVDVQSVVEVPAKIDAALMDKVNNKVEKA